MIKGEWEKHFQKSYLMCTIPEKVILTNGYVINFKDGTIISDKINLDLNNYNFIYYKI